VLFITGHLELTGKKSAYSLTELSVFKSSAMPSQVVV